jgi:predicted ArsR family transcriptional regulator
VTGRTWTATDDRILVRLHGTRGLTVREVTVSERISRQVASQRLELMLRDRLVARTQREPDGRGRCPYVYYLTERGELRVRTCPAHEANTREANGVRT